MFQNKHVCGIHRLRLFMTQQCNTYNFVYENNSMKSCCSLLALFEVNIIIQLMHTGV